MSFERGYTTDRWQDRYHYQGTEAYRGGNEPDIDLSQTPVNLMALEAKRQGYKGYQKAKQERRASAEAWKSRKAWARGPKTGESMSYGSINVLESDADFLSRMDSQAAGVRQDALVKKPVPKVTTYRGSSGVGVS